MATNLSKEDMAKGGRNGSRRGIPNRKTLARKLLTGLGEAGSGNATLKTVQEILDGKHGNPLRLEIAKMVFEAGLETNAAAELARLKARLRSQELILSSILRQATKAEATAIYNKIEAQDAAEQEQEEPDDDR